MIDSKEETQELLSKPRTCHGLELQWDGIQSSAQKCRCIYMLTGPSAGVYKTRHIARRQKSQNSASLIFGPVVQSNLLEKAVMLRMVGGKGKRKQSFQKTQWLDTIKDNTCQNIKQLKEVPS